MAPDVEANGKAAEDAAAASGTVQALSRRCWRQVVCMHAPPCI